MSPVVFRFINAWRGGREYSIFRSNAGINTFVPFFNFITYGAYRVICVWLNREDREPPQQIARQMIRFIRMEQT